MSGIALIWQREPAPPPVDAHRAMMAALAHRGIDGAHTLASPRSLLGHAHFWTTPEEVGERQPLRHDEAGFDLALDGRLDNRQELIRALAPEVGPEASDAAVAAAAYERWGEGCLERFVGPFALVVVDHRERRLLAARDPLGDRTLCYAVRPEALVVASEEQAVLQHPSVGDALDERTLVTFLAVRPPEEGATCFAEVSELPPGHLLVAEGGAVNVRRYWELDPAMDTTRSEGEHQERFLELLEEAVRCRLRSVSRSAILMSGGLDSTSVAALAVASRPSQGTPLAISWVFDQLASADERRYMEPLVAALGLEAIFIPGDDAWTLSPTTQWATDPNLPAESPLRALRERTYDALGLAGCRTVLSGDGGDHLFFGSEYWLKSLLAHRGALPALMGLVAHGWWHGVQRLSVKVPLRSAMGRALGLRRPGRRPPAPRPWLTPHAQSLLGEGATPPASLDERERLARRQCATDRWLAWGIRADRRSFLARGIDHRRPFRDRRLVEHVASVPAHLLHSPGESKRVLRRAVRGLMPESVRTRRWVSSHLPLVARGLADRELDRVRELLTAPDAVWARYVSAERLWESFPDLLRSGRDGAESVVAWHCICLELWRHHRRPERARIEPVTRVA